jgi:membrane protease YdiL (CAAX protease family)
MSEMVQDRRPSAVAALARRHPVALFLGLVLVGVNVVSLVPILVQFEVLPGKTLPARVGLDMERAAVIPMMLVLVIATFSVTAWEGGRPAVRALVRRMLRWRVGLVWWLVAATGLPLLTVTAAVLLGDQAHVPSPRVLAGEIVGIAVAFLLVNLWEETAWTGFLQTRLERRHTFVVAAALTAIPFAAVHLPLRVITGEITSPASLAANLTLLLVLGLVVRPLFGMVQRGAANSLLLVGLTHTMFNRSNNLDGIAADILTGPNRPLAALLATVALTLLLGVLIRRKLSMSYRRELDEAETSHHGGS